MKPSEDGFSAPSARNRESVSGYQFHEAQVAFENGRWSAESLRCQRCGEDPVAGCIGESAALPHAQFTGSRLSQCHIGHTRQTNRMGNLAQLRVSAICTPRWPMRWLHRSHDQHPAREGYRHRRAGTESRSRALPPGSSLCHEHPRPRQRPVRRQDYRWGGQVPGKDRYR